MRSLFIAAALFAASVSVAAADSIAGNWTTEAGTTAAIAPCGSAFCITMRSGSHAGKRIGTMSPKGENKFAGTIVDPATDKSYSGYATLSGNSLSLSGCVMGGIICKSQTWSRR